MKNLIRRVVTGHDNGNVTAIFTAIYLTTIIVLQMETRKDGAILRITD